MNQNDKSPEHRLQIAMAGSTPLQPLRAVGEVLGQTKYVELDVGRWKGVARWKRTNR